MPKAARPSQYCPWLMLTTLPEGVRWVKPSRSAVLPNCKLDKTALQLCEGRTAP